MHCNEIQNLILLEDSGEITAGQRQPLAGHLEACADCRALKTELASLRQTLGTADLSRITPSRKVLETIQTAARKPHPRFHWHLAQPWKVALATAASLTLCLTGVQVMNSRQATSNIEALAEQLVILQEENLNAADDVAAEDFTLLEDGLTTTLRGNSIPASPRGKDV
ncbi:MAG: hypothetical protein WCO77_09525 [bacterium]